MLIANLAGITRRCDECGRRNVEHGITLEATLSDEYADIELCFECLCDLKTQLDAYVGSLVREIL